MNILRPIVGFMSGSDDSMRYDAVSERVREQMGDLNYKTIAESNREMRGDKQRLFGKSARRAAGK